MKAVWQCWVGLETCWRSWRCPGAKKNTGADHFVDSESHIHPERAKISNQRRFNVTISLHLLQLIVIGDGYLKANLKKRKFWKVPNRGKTCSLVQFCNFVALHRKPNELAHAKKTILVNLETYFSAVHSGIVVPDSELKVDLVTFKKGICSNRP